MDRTLGLDTASGHPGGLMGVQCLNDDDVWAVGWRGESQSATKSLIMHWDGGKWSRVPSPDPGGVAGNSRLTSVSGGQSDDLWAVGTHVVAGQGLTGLVVHWDGRVWRARDLGSTQTGRIWLSVTSPSSDDVWIFGTDLLYSTSFIEHWDGASWSSVAPADPGRPFVLASAKALSPSNVWAVGYTGSGHRQLIEHWDGSSWRIVEGPNLDHVNRLVGVSALGGTDMWAIGHSGGSGGGGFESEEGKYNPKRALTEHYDGQKWDRVHAPSPQEEAELLAVYAQAPSDVWAVGSSTKGPLLSNLTEHWDGEAWRRVTSPSPQGSGTLTGVDGCHGSSVWAVGYSFPSAGHNERTWIQQWTDASWRRV